MDIESKVLIQNHCYPILVHITVEPSRSQTSSNGLLAMSKQIRGSPMQPRNSFCKQSLQE